MAKLATVKDVLYALEYLNGELCCWPGRSGAWSLEPMGQKVLQRVADEARAHGQITASQLSKYGEARYVWKRAA